MTFIYENLNEDTLVFHDIKSLADTILSDLLDLGYLVDSTCYCYHEYIDNKRYIISHSSTVLIGEVRLYKKYMEVLTDIKQFIPKHIPGMNLTAILEDADIDNTWECTVISPPIFGKFVPKNNQEKMSYLDLEKKVKDVVSKLEDSLNNKAKELDIIHKIYRSLLCTNYNHLVVKTNSTIGKIAKDYLYASYVFNNNFKYISFSRDKLMNPYEVTMRFNTKYSSLKDEIDVIKEKLDKRYDIVSIVKDHYKALQLNVSHII